MMPTNMKRKLADIVALMPGRRTFKTEAARATTRKHTYRNKSSECQRKIAYGKSGSPPMSWVKMNVTAGTPSDCKSSQVMLQKFSLFVTSTRALALYYPNANVLSPDDGTPEPSDQTGSKAVHHTVKWIGSITAQVQT